MLIFGGVQEIVFAVMCYSKTHLNYSRRGNQKLKRRQLQQWSVVVELSLQTRQQS